MGGITISADVDREIRISSETFEQFDLEIGDVDEAFFEVNFALLVDGDVENFGFILRGGFGGGGEIDLDGLEADHLEAHHHERCQEEEHDVDQRDDFDAGLLVWQW